MGVTIHFEGQLKSYADYDNLVNQAIEFSKLNEMEFSFIEEDNRHLQRVKNEGDWDYHGPTKESESNHMKILIH